jgi:hypothetical protein
MLAGYFLGPRAPLELRREENVPRGPLLVGSTENESRSLRILDGRIGSDRTESRTYRIQDRRLPALRATFIVTV